MQKFARPLCALALLCLGITGSRAQGTPTVFINEIHYDNTGTDTGEFIESPDRQEQICELWAGAL
jgi:hypothetical protein